MQGISVAYGDREVLQEAWLACRPGEMIGLLGPNGAGKSTLLKAVVGLVPRTVGRVLLDGRPLEGRAARSPVAYVPQRNDVDWDFPIGVEEVVLLGMVAGTTVVSVNVVGVVLTVAVLVTPAATASLWGATLGRTMVVAGVVAALAGVVGLYVAYYVPVAPAATIVLVLGGCFALSALVAPRGPLRGPRVMG